MDRLLSCFVESFAKLDDLMEFPELNPVARALATSERAPYGMIRWSPVRSVSEASLLDSIYAKLPARFPPLYERFVSTYRWAEVDLKTYTLLANPPGEDLSGLYDALSGDVNLWDELIPAGFVRFGKGPDCDYDPVCFDISSRRKNRECRIVKIDHEEILCNYRVKVVAVLANSFEELVRNTIALATKSG